MQTEKNSNNLKIIKKPYSHALTFGILERLFLFRRLRNDLDSTREKNADVLAVAIVHFHEQIEVLSLIGVRYEERLRRAVPLRKKKKRSSQREKYTKRETAPTQFLTVFSKLSGCMS